MAEIQKTLAGVRLAMEAGETFTKGDLNEILGGDVEVVQVAKAEGEDEAHPLQTPLLELYTKMFAEDGTIRKGVTSENAQAAFEATYQKMATEFDGAIDAAVEATAIELGKGGAVTFGKSGRKPVTGKDTAGDGDDDAGHEDMDKMLKGSPAGRAILKQLTDLGAEVRLLRGERDTNVFAKKAEEIGEPASFAADLMKIHQIDPKLADSIGKRLGAKNQLITKARAWGTELGEGGQSEAGDTAIEKMNALAREKVSKSDGKLTLAKAFTQVCTEQPELYAQYGEEQRAARR
ncbi:MAG: hypothetical protein ACHRHE_15645 [Tepidisphaerales bacterium]